MDDPFKLILPQDTECVNAFVIREQDPRAAYFVLSTQYDDCGWIPLIALEGERGYNRTAWRWNCTYKEAHALCTELNARLGLTEKDAMQIIVSTF